MNLLSLAAGITVARSAGIVDAGEQIHVLALVTRCDELLEPELFEVEGEIVEELGLPRIVAVQVDDLAFEVPLVLLELFLYVGQLRVELVRLDALGLKQAVPFRCHQSPSRDARRVSQS